MYQFKRINLTELDKNALEKGNIFQGSNWANFKKKYGKIAFSGTDEEGREVLTCLILTVPVIPTIMKIGYAVRGFVCDLTNTALVTAFTEFLRDYMKKHHIVYITLDPFESYKTDFILTEEGKIRHQNLLDSGYEFFENKAFSLQRPTNYRVTWDRNKTPAEQEKEVYSKMKKMLQNSIQNAENRGLSPLRFKGEEITEEVFAEFIKLFKITAEIKNFGMKSEEYYRNLLESFREYSSIYFFEYNAETDRLFTEKTLKKLQEEISRIESLEEKARERKKAHLNELKEEYKSIFSRLETIEKYKEAGYLSSFYTINFGSRCQLYFGANSPILRELKLTAHYWPMLKDCFDGVCESFDMGGTLRLDTEDVKKDKTYDLYLYKSRYGGVLDELLGEYYLINSKFWYKILHQKLHYLRRYAIRF